MVRLRVTASEIEVVQCILVRGWCGVGGWGLVECEVTEDVFGRGLLEGYGMIADCTRVLAN